MERVIIASGIGGSAKGSAMARKHDPDDPVIYSKATGWHRLKGWPLALIVIVGALVLFILFAGVVTLIAQTLGLSA